MNSKITYEVSEEDLKKVVHDTFVKEVEARIYGRFYNSFIDGKQLANMHQVSQDTITRYVKDGLLSPEPRLSNNASLKFRLSYALGLDFEELKKQKRHGLLSNTRLRLSS